MKKCTGKLGIVFIGIVINLGGRFLADYFNLPIWLDMVGTCVATYFAGIWGGLITGLFNNVFSAFSDPVSLFYTITSVGAAIIMHLFIKRGYMEKALSAAVSSFWLGIICVMLATPVNYIFYDGYSGNIWGDTLVDMLRWHEFSKIVSSLAGECIVEIIDKQVCILLAYFIIKFVKKRREMKLQKVAALFLAICIFAIGMLQPMAVLAATEKPDERFFSTIYNNTNGMVSSEANAICETDDGYIWIGSYAGLTRFDGRNFEFVREPGLVNVVGMMTDSKGRLWIGTNDAGIARYENGEYTYFTEEDGLPSYSVRCFVEDKEGNVYVGTTGKMCKINKADEIEVLPYDISFVKYMVCHDDMIVAMDNGGGLYGIKDGQVLETSDAELKGEFFYCLADTAKGLMVGTDDGKLYVLEDGTNFMHLKRTIPFSAKEISAIFEDSKERIWVATESGFGYFSGNNVYHEIQNTGFDTSIDAFYEDYQGNIWVVSAHYGVMKLVENQFANLFDISGISKRVTNAITLFDGKYYVGTDTGAVVIDIKTHDVIENEFTDRVKGNRVRAFFVDSKNVLWACTYNGLYSLDETGKIECYTMEKHGTTSDRYRCMTETADGKLVVGTADGMNYIENGTVTKTVSSKEGLENTQILSVVEGKDGLVWAGSDGSGIYILSDGEIVENYTIEDGLSSNIILRIVPYDAGYLIVTSNSLCHVDLKGKIRRLSNFPYYNNYDVIVVEDDAYITCSAGLYRMKLADLVINNGMQYSFYGANEGLLAGLTANSWNYLTEDNTLFLCSNEGAIIFENPEMQSEVDLKFGIDFMEFNGKKTPILSNETVTIPPNTKNISIHGSVKNYAFTEEKVRFFIKGTEDEAKITEWNEIEPIHISKPDKLEYVICFQIMDNAGKNVLQEAEYTIGKSRHPWQDTRYRVYLATVSIEIIAFVIVNLTAMILFAIRKNELEASQKELEQKVSEQTEELRLQEKKTKNLFIKTVTALSEAVDAKDRYTSGHSKRVAEYSLMIAKKLGKSKEEQEEIYRAGLLHDVGKIRIPREIINKAGKLNDDEYNTIKIHPVTGNHILRGISEDDKIALGAKYHHERYDGKGYPNGLSGEKIPEVARILGVADSYDAMTSNRSYRNALPQEVVRQELLNGRGTQFDPVMADIMLAMMDEDVNYEMKQSDSLLRKILVVDDEPICTKIIKKIMSDEPMYKIDSVDSGKEALEILEKEHYDLILLDVRMPDMDGIETLRQIRDKYDIPVAFMTSDRNDEALIQFSQYGCDEYITKPFQPLLLKEIVHNISERTVITKE